MTAAAENLIANNGGFATILRPRECARQPETGTFYVRDNAGTTPIDDRRGCLV